MSEETHQEDLNFSSNSKIRGGGSWYLGGGDSNEFKDVLLQRLGK